MKTSNLPRTLRQVAAIWTTATMLFGFSFLASVEGQESSSDSEPKKEKTLFESVAHQMSTRYYDKEFRRNQLPALIEEYRPLAEKAKTLKEQRDVTFRMLSRVPASHLGVLSKSSYDQLMGELFNKTAPTLGLELMELGDQYYAHSVLEGGPAARAGIRAGDRILSMDKKRISDHPRLDYRTDDSYLADPAVHSLLCKDGDKVIFKIDRGRSQIESVEVVASPYSAFEAAKASCRIIEKDGLKIGHVHFWFIHIQGVGKLLKEKLEGDFKDCDALILDLRGRGGNGGACRGIVDIVSGKKSDWDKPTIALIDRNSRSAKEVIALFFKNEKSATLVGEKTAGAVIPATFKDVGHDTYLMFPTFTLGKLTERLEGHGVEPDVAVEMWRPYAKGKDPILLGGIAECVRQVQSKKTNVDNSGK